MVGAPMSRWFSFAMVGLAVPVAGCASFSGMPEPIMPLADAVAIPAEYQRATALETYAEYDGDEKDADRREFRNRVVSLYLSVADARYLEFRRAISRDAKGSNFAFDAGVVVLGGIGAVAKGAANELSAAAAALAGTRGALNKEVYFERTLPAIIATMEANRLRVRGEILLRLRQDAVSYPLEQAFGDITQYQLATTMDGAIQQIATAAGQSAAAEEAKYASAIESCDPDDVTGAYWKRFNHFVYDLAKGAANGVPAAGSEDEKKLIALEGVAKLLGDGTAKRATTLAEAKAQAALAIDLTDPLCSEAKVTRLFDTIQTTVGRPVP